MARSAGKKAVRKTRGADKQPSDTLRPGMPAKDSVRAVEDFVSPQGVKYRILKTTERDAYDALPAPGKKSPRKS